MNDESSLIRTLPSFCADIPSAVIVLVARLCTDVTLGGKTDEDIDIEACDATSQFSRDVRLSYGRS